MNKRISPSLSDLTSLNKHGECDCAGCRFARALDAGDADAPPEIIFSLYEAGIDLREMYNDNAALTDFLTSTNLTPLQRQMVIGGFARGAVSYYAVFN